MPAGKALLVPIITVLAGELCLGPGTVDGLYRYAASRIDHVTELGVMVDGVPLACPSLYRAVSPVFSGQLPHHNIMGVDVPPGIQGLNFQAVADGYWVILEPLSPGEHEVCFRGAYEAPCGHFSASVAYRLHVQAGPPQAVSTAAPEAGAPWLVAPEEGADAGKATPTDRATPTDQALAEPST